MCETSDLSRLKIKILRLKVKTQEMLKGTPDIYPVFPLSYERLMLILKLRGTAMEKAHLSETGLSGTIVDTADLKSTFCLPSP